MDEFDPYMPPSDLMVKSCCDEFYCETPIRIKRPVSYNEFAE